MRSARRSAAVLVGLAAAIALAVPGTAGAEPLFETLIAYDGQTTIAQGGPATLSATLSDGAFAGLGGRIVTLTLGTGASNQNCTATTNSSGHAQCTIAVVSVAVGLQPLAARFAGDAFYAPASDTSATATVFAFAGAFVLGNRTVENARPDTTVEWWGAEWWKENELSGGSAPASFKGFADPPAPTACGTTWTSRPGNSSGPPAAVPGFIAVLVTSKVTKSGSTISGDTRSIVVVKTDPGYGPAPGHRGTGTVVAVVCEPEL